MRLLPIALVGVTSLALVAGPAQAEEKPRVPTLTGFASLPAATFVQGSEPSGSLLGAGPINGVTVPFANQPVQGFSGIVREKGKKTFEVLTDNGYGNIKNSADFLLRINRIEAKFGKGDIEVVDGFNLSDPDGHVPFPLTRPDRILTGADLDPESMIKTEDGHYWIGDEFGPYLLHFDGSGRLLAPPYALPGVFSPESAARAGVPATLGGSRGFEGLSHSPDGRYLYAMLEGTVVGDPRNSLRINEFDTHTGAFTGKRWRYNLDARGLAIGDFAAVGDGERFVVIERDNFEGAAAQVKKVYLITLDGQKTLLVDLLNIADPKHLGGDSDVFRFPFFTIENIIVLDKDEIGVLNDNNYPLSAGRTPGAPDNNEFITIRLSEKLW